MKKIFLLTIFLSYSCLALMASANTQTAVAAETKPVPEPASMLLLGSGLVGLACVSKKKKQK